MKKPLVCEIPNFQSVFFLRFEHSSALVDPATSIAFPKILNIPSTIPLPTYTLLGLGVRTVSFLGIKVYSVGFYADLGNPRLNVSLPPL
jgi:hypothetical protein